MLTVILTLSKQALVFTYLQYKSFENSVEKGEIAHNKQFLLFLQCFLPSWRTFSQCHRFYPFPNKPWFLRIYSTILLKTQWEKEKLLVTSNFSFLQCFEKLSAIFIKFEIVVCKLFEWKSLKFVVWERVKMLFANSFS